VLILLPSYIVLRRRRSSESRPNYGKNHITALSLLCLAVLFSAKGAVGNEQRTAPQDNVIVDGSRHPERISDYKAWEFFLQAMAISEDEGSAMKERVRDRFFGANLSE